MKTLLILSCFLIQANYTYCQIDPCVLKFIITDKSRGPSDINVKQLAYKLNGDVYVSDSFKISYTRFYITSEARRSDRKMNRKSGKFKKIKGVYIINDGNKYQVNDILEWRDTIPKSSIDSVILNLETEFNGAITLKHFNISKSDIKNRLTAISKHMIDTSYIDSIQQKLTPEYMLPFVTIGHWCKNVCAVASHPTTRVLTIQFELKKNKIKTIRTEDCHRFSYHDMLFLAPLLSNSNPPPELFVKSFLYSKTLLIDWPIRYLYSTFKHTDCLFPTKSD